MKPSSGAINIEASARKLDVDNRISLRNYYRIANNLIKQANIYRNERNIIDLYVMLLRFSSLITETIPQHRDYNFSFHDDRKFFKKILLNALNELETLQPDVRRKLDVMNGRPRNQIHYQDYPHQNGFLNNSFEWHPVNNLTSGTKESSQKVGGMLRKDGFYTVATVQDNKLLTKTKEEQFRKLSLTLLPPKPETLSRHSILGPNGLHGQWQPPSANHGVQYPRTLDLTPIEIPSLLQLKGDTPFLKDNGAPEHEEKKSISEEVLSLHRESLQPHQDSGPMIDLDNTKLHPEIDIIKELCPPPVLAEVHDVPLSSQTSNTIATQTLSLQVELLQSESPVEVYISTTMMDTFMRVAKSNTIRNLETCGVLAGSLENRKFHVTALIIPKQESTSDSCQTTNEEEIFDYQEKHSLFPLGWIHTHPTQSCFMSSIDVHTHYAYQVMLPEAIAIVMAPRDGSRTHGIFRLTTPGGMSVIRHCDQRGFHPHSPPPDGGNIYKQCSDVYMDPGIKFDVVDLR